MKPLRWLAPMGALLSLTVAVAGDPPGPNASGLTALLGAFDPEVAFLEGQIADKHTTTVLGARFVTGTLNGRKVVLACTGIGKVNAAMTTALMLSHFKPTEVIFTGIAGGLNKDLLPGDIVIAEGTVQHDVGGVTEAGFKHQMPSNPITGKPNPAIIRADAALLANAQASVKRVKFQPQQTEKGQREPRVITGIVATGDVFIASAAKSAEIRRMCKADAVEMEGAAVAQVCSQLATPCIVIRSLSDMADKAADQDLAKFYRTAAHNSATLVREMVGQLAKPSVPTSRASSQCTSQPVGKQDN